jgi:O-antigen/teichoic acid export membrane protein
LDVPEQRSVVSSTLATFLFGILASGLSLANVLLVARFLGATGRGEVVFLMTMATLAARFSALGVAEANVNIGSAEPRTRGRLATNSLVLALGSGWLAGATVLALSSAFPAFAAHSDPALRWLAMAAIPLLVWNTSLLRLLHADYRFDVANAATVAPPAVGLLLNMALAASGAFTVGTALAAWVVGWSAGTLVLAAYAHRRLAPFARPDRRLARRMISFGAKSYLGRVMSAGNYRLDQWILGSIAGTRELGLYSIAVAWFETLTYLPTALAVVLRPDMVRMSPRAAAARSAMAFRAAFVVTSAFVIAMVVAAPILSVMIFGEGFRDSTGMIRVLAPAAFGIMALRILGSSLTGQGKPMLETAAIGVGLVVTVALDVALIPPYGGIGAALASVAAYSAMGIAVAVFFSRALDSRLIELRPRVKDVRLMWTRGRAAVSVFRTPRSSSERELHD